METLCDYKLLVQYYLKTYGNLYVEDICNPYAYSNIVYFINKINNELFHDQDYNEDNSFQGDILNLVKEISIIFEMEDLVQS